MIESSSEVGAESRTTEPEQLSMRVVEAVADAEGVDPVELDPLYTTVDPDAIEDVFRPQLTTGSVPDPTAEIRFEYHGYEVRVTATGRVSLAD